MGLIGLRMRRGLLGALLSALAVLALFSAAAHAEFAMETLSSISADASSNWWNGITPLSSGTYQYIAYWDAPDREGVVYAELTRRNVTTNATESVIFNGLGGRSDEHLEFVNDGHNVLAVGLSPNDGRIHMSYSNHHAVHHYAMSSERCLSATRLSECTFDWTRFQTREALDINDSGRLQETERVITYPFYFNDDRGRLWFSYRFGSSLHADQWLNLYNDNGTWTNKGMMMLGRSPSGAETYEYTRGDGSRVTSRQRGIYLTGLAFDHKDRLHVSWTWREWPSPTNGGGQDLHGLYYAYSDDDARTWNTSSGTRFATSTSEPIVVSDSAALVDTAPDGSTPAMAFGSAPYGGYIKLDSNNQPHLIISMAENVAEARGDDTRMKQRLAHFWRSPSGTWYSTWVLPANTNATPTWGSSVFDAADNLYYIYNADPLDFTPWNRALYVQEDLTLDHATWQSGSLHIVPMSAITALDTSKYVNVPLGTSRGQNYKIQVRMKNNTVGRSFQFYWTTDASPGWEARRGESFAINANDREFQTYTFTVRTAEWRGQLRELELYPAGLGDVHGERGEKEIDIDYIKITDDRETPVVAKAWEFEQGVSVSLIGSSSTDNWRTWTEEPLLAGVNDARADALFEVDQARYRASGNFSFASITQGAPGTTSVDVHDVKDAGDTIAKDWSFPVDTQLWTARQQISEFRWSTDTGRTVVGGTITGEDSALVSEDKLAVPLEGTTSSTITLRLKNSTTSRTGRIWFITNSDGTYNATKSKSFEIRSESTYTDYTIEMGRVEGWAGQTLRQLRIDPADDARVTTGSFKIDRIRVNRRAP